MLNESTLAENTALVPVKNEPTGGYGGVIIVARNVELTVQGCRATSNTVEGDAGTKSQTMAGGFMSTCFSARATLSDSHFVANQARLSTGTVRAVDSASISSCEITSAFGGAVMRSNTARALGGPGNSQQEGARGGALFVAAPGVAKLAECRLLDNVAVIFVAAVSASGGALYIEGSAGSATSQSAVATLKSCTLRNSTALLAGLWYVIVAVPSQADTRLSSIGATWSTNALGGMFVTLWIARLPQSHRPTVLRSPVNGSEAPMWKGFTCSGM